jgi:hypothetical protein
MHTLGFDFGAWTHKKAIAYIKYFTKNGIQLNLGKQLDTADIP